MKRPGGAVGEEKKQLEENDNIAMPRSEAERIKHNGRVVNSHRTRLRWMNAGTAVCAVCGWTGPQALQGKYGLVQPHHVRGVGSPELIHDIEHQIPLCPNHHVIAERAFGHTIPPLTKDELIAKLTEFDGAGAT
jgi:predicted restriction endonuclease